MFVLTILRVSRRSVLFFFLTTLFFACKSPNPSLDKLSIGVVNLESQGNPLEAYLELKTYLSEQLSVIAELEPSYNERKAKFQIQRQSWDLVFASSGIAAIAMTEAGYRPILPLEGGLKTRSVIVVLEDSSFQELSDLMDKTVALQQPGSATGYYLPIYNLYGLNLAEIRLANTAKDALTWLSNKEIDAVALSAAELNTLRSEFPSTKFRILFTDSHEIPAGSVLISPNIEANQEEQIRQVLVNASPTISSSTGYLTNAPLPDYQYMIEVVKRVMPLSDKIMEKPVKLY